VLALAYKKMDFNEEMNVDFSKIERNVVENNLTFCGFYICDSPLKRDSAKHIKILKEAAYQILMITGDNLLTAISVGH
jgi:cation-transporting ATPase 13A1